MVKNLDLVILEAAKEWGNRKHLELMGALINKLQETNFRFDYEPENENWLTISNEKPFAMVYSKMPFAFKTSGFNFPLEDYVENIVWCDDINDYDFSVSPDIFSKYFSGRSVSPEICAELSAQNIWYYSVT